MGTPCYTMIIMSSISALCNLVTMKMTKVRLRLSNFDNISETSFIVHQNIT